MFQIVFLATIIGLTIGDEISMNLGTFQLLTKDIDITEDAGARPFCKAPSITTLAQCKNTVSGSVARGGNGMTVDRSKTEGGCVWFRNPFHPIPVLEGSQCVPPAIIAKIRKNGFGGPPENNDDGSDEIIMDSEFLYALLANSEIDPEALGTSCSGPMVTNRMTCMLYYSGSVTAGGNGRTVSRSVNGKGGCIWFADTANDIVVANGGEQCLPPARIVAARPRIPAPPASLFDKIELLSDENITANMNYIALSIAIIGLIVGIGACCYRRDMFIKKNEELLVNDKSETYGTYQSV